MSLLRLLFLLVCLFAALTVSAQNDDRLWQSLLEEWVEQSDAESLPDDLMEQLQDYFENPINLNDTASGEIYSLPFLTDYQCDAIRAYIAMNGLMASPAELYLLNGFDSLSLQLLRLFTTVAPLDNDNSLSLKQIASQGRSNFRTGFKTVRPLSRGYLEDKYAGDPYRVYFRYNFRYRDKIAFQLSGDKDAGESFRDQHPLPGFDNNGFYLAFNNLGVLRRAIVGKYNLQFGQGATLWSGYSSWHAGNMPLWRYGQGIRPAGPFAEYGYFCGAAATVAIAKHLELTAFYSNVKRDATLADTADDGTLIFQSIYNSGYHRTANEISKENLLREQLYGFHLQYGRSKFAIGATAYATHFDDLLVPVKYKYNGFAFRGKDNFNAGIDFTWRYRKLTLFGEAAMAYNDSLAVMRQQSDFMPVTAIAGAQYHFNANNNVSVAARYGSPLYHNLYSNTIGQSDDAYNDAGVMVFFQTRLPFYINLRGTVDFFRRPWMRYRVYSPSNGTDVRLLATKELVRNVLFEVRYRYHSDMRNRDSELFNVERTVKHQVTGGFILTPSDHWTLQTKAIYTHFGCEDHDSERGIVFYQDVAWHSLGKRPLTLAARFTLFNVTGYDARIYTYESDLVYEYAVPMLLGKGIRTGLVMRYEMSYNLSFAFKYAVSYYPDQESMGSSYEKIEGNVKHEVKAQLRWRF